MQHFFKGFTIAAMMLNSTPTSVDDPAIAQDGHRLAIHIDENEPFKTQLALANADNLREGYEARGEDVTIEIVIYGPGIAMLTEDSPVADRIATMSLIHPDMTVSVCQHMIDAFESQGRDGTLLDEATRVEPGILRLVDLQEAGYAYAKP